MHVKWWYTSTASFVVERTCPHRWLLQCACRWYGEKCTTFIKVNAKGFACGEYSQLTLCFCSCSSFSNCNILTIYFNTIYIYLLSTEIYTNLYTFILVHLNLWMKKKKTACSCLSNITANKFFVFIFYDIRKQSYMLLWFKMLMMMMVRITILYWGCSFFLLWYITTLGSNTDDIAK